MRIKLILTTAIDGTVEGKKKKERGRLTSLRKEEIKK